jgi:hypothetical protein
MLVGFGWQWARARKTRIGGTIVGSTIADPLLPLDAN